MQTDSAAALAALGSHVRRLPWHIVTRPVARTAGWVMALPVWLVLSVLVGIQWLVVAVVASMTPHNGWVHYSGGDDSWYYTSAWVLGHGHVPQAYVGYGYSFLIAPLARIAGPLLPAGMPLVVGFNVLVLWPIALLCVYGIAKIIGGRGFAYLALVAWTVFPLAVIPYFDPRYHVRYVDQNLPSAMGLVATADFPSMVAVLAAAYFTLRALYERSPQAALVAGGTVGFAVATKPSNLIFLPAPLAALAVARRGRELLLLCAGLAPSLLALALWKYRGLGNLPAFSASVATLAAGTPLTLPPLGGIGFDRYLRVDWGHLWTNKDAIREYTWSLRLVTWILVAGVVALARRSAYVAVLIGGWLASYIVFKGAALDVNFTDGSFFRFMMPAYPAFFFFVVTLPLLVPVAGRRLAAGGRAAASAPGQGRSWSAIVAIVGALSVLPLIAFAAFRPLTAPAATTVPQLDQYVPAGVFGLNAHARADKKVELRWPTQDRRGTRAGYAIFRLPADGLMCTPRDNAASACLFSTSPSGYGLVPLTRTIRTSFVDTPPAGHWVYRVGATVSPYGARPGNFVALSRAASVDVPA